MNKSVKEILIPSITLAIGLAFGSSGNISSNAEEVSTSIVQGEILKICINKKTGIIRASSNCDAKLERKTTIGGVGPKGEKGETGAIGSTGPQGPQGLKGEPGAPPNLRIQTIYYLGGTSCNYRNAEYSYVTDILRSPQTGDITWFGKGTLSGCYITVYVPQ